MENPAFIPYDELTDKQRDLYIEKPAEQQLKARAGLRGPAITGHEPIVKTGALSPMAYSYPADQDAVGRFAFADEVSSKAAMEADFDALASQIEDYAVDPENSPLAFGTPDEQLHAMRVLAAWHGEGEPTRDLASYCNAVEPMLKQSLAARGIEWDRARGAKAVEKDASPVKDGNGAIAALVSERFSAKRAASPAEDCARATASARSASQTERSKSRGR